MPDISPNYKKNLKPKEFHPSVHLVQIIFQSAGRDYVRLLMDDLAAKVSASEDPSEDVHGVIYETLRKLEDGEGLNDRYLMGAAIYLLATLLPFNVFIPKAVEELTAAPEEDADETASS